MKSFAPRLSSFGADRHAWLLTKRAIRDVLRIAGGVALAQFLAVAAVPLLTRLYEPHALGQFALFNAILTILTPLVSLRYEMALPLPDGEEHAFDLLALCFGLVVAASLVVVLLEPLLWPLLADWSEVDKHDGRLLPLATLTVGVQAVMMSWLVRNRAFSQIAQLRFTTIVGSIGFQLLLGILHAGSRSLVLGLIGGYLLGFLAGARQNCRSLSRGLIRVSFRGLRRAAGEYRLFAMVSAPSGIVNALGAQAPSVILPMLYGTAVTGQYSLAQRALAQPMILIGQAVKQVLWGNSARLLVDQPRQLWPVFLRLNLCLMASMAPGLLLVWHGPEIFGAVFGRGWEPAGRYAGILIFASMVGLPALGTTALELYRLNHWMSAWEVLRLALVAATLGAVKWLSLPPLTCIIALTATSALTSAILLGLNACALRRLGARGEIQVQGAEEPRLG